MAVGGGILAVIGGFDDDDSDGSQRLVEVSEVWSGELAIPGELRVVQQEEATVSEPASDAPPAVVDAPVPVALSETEAVICGVFVGYCADALAVARCESGPDYYAPPAVYHTGTFQLAFRYHAGKFAARGWDMYAEGDDFYRNSVIAYEIFAGRGFSWLGTSGWPVCGLRAGY